jgi:hypothetical protein
MAANALNGNALGPVPSRRVVFGILVMSFTPASFWVRENIWLNGAGQFAAKIKSTHVACCEAADSIGAEAATRCYAE